MSSIDKLPYLVQLPQEKMFCVSFTEPWLYPMLYINNHIGEDKKKADCVNLCVMYSLNLH